MSMTDRRRSRRVLAAGTAALILILILLWPLKTPATPRWDVWVVDEFGRPVQGINVDLSWQNYSAEGASHDERRQTDEDGHVSFRARSLRRPIFARILYTVRSSMALAHASFGPHAYVFAYGRGMTVSQAIDGTTAYWEGKPAEMKTRLLMKPVPEETSQGTK